MALFCVFNGLHRFQCYSDFWDILDSQREKVEEIGIFTVDSMESRVCACEVGNNILNHDRQSQ